jgi:site-specific recombinase XerD
MSDVHALTAIVELSLSLKSVNTKRRYMSVWSEWIHHVGMDRSRMTQAEAARYLAACKARPAQPGRSRDVGAKCSAATVHHKAVILSALFDELISYKIISDNPFERLKKDFSKTKTGDRRPHNLITVEQVKLILSLPHRNKEGIRDSALLAIMFGCGLRRSEVSRLTLEDVKSTEHGSVYLRLLDTKSGTTQQVAIADWVLASVSKLIEQRRAEVSATNGPLFCVYYADTPTKRTLSPSTIYRTFKYYCKAAGLSDHYTPHCARVTAITHLLNQGFSHRDVCHFSRHSSIQMVERYDKRRLSVEESIAKKIAY